MMAGLREYVESEGCEQFKKAIYLSKEASKNDPEDEPYKSFYEAREILSDIRTKIQEMRNGDPNNKDLLLALSTVDLHLGSNFTDTDETSSGEEYLSRVVTNLEDMKMEEGAVSIYLHALNHLGILWCARSRHDKAKNYLDQAENLFHEYKKNVGDAPKRADEFFLQAEEDESDLLRQRAGKFEATHTHTLYYKAQVLAKLGDDKGSAKYCHTTLHRQLESNEYDPTDWALNAATLSQVYITQEKFHLARHCLASSSIIFQETKPDGEASEEARENWDYKDADIHRCWIKYGLQLLEVSKDKMLEQVQTFDEDHGLGENSTENSAMADHNYDKKPKSDDENMKEDGEGEDKSFEPFNLEVTSYEEKVTDKLMKTFDEARQVFLFIQDGITHAKKTYTLDGNCSDFIELTQDHSKAFKLLAFFELDMERQCRMHKRRVDMLLALLNEVSLQHYLLVCRQLIYEVAETYGSMLDIKLSMIELEGNTPTPHAARKINTLARQSIKQYQAYMDTLKGGKPDLPDTFPDGNTRPALIAMFCCGRLWGKILSPEVSERLACMKQSMESYKFVVDYCRRHPEAKFEVEKEHALCVELAALLPVKMEKIRGEND